MRFWLDTNVLVRLITRQPEEMFRRTVAFLRKAEANRYTLSVHPLHVAEAIYVLRGVYGFSLERLLTDLRHVLRLRLLEVDEHVLEALALMERHRVDFDDAFLAVLASSRGESVLSFDRDFARLPVNWKEP
ncbi:PIN domain-containing protein [Rhodothermus marinus]|uniref:PIN domain-containing protein n=1 Tax=Rhodothermus marinus TaxID=29549 RepID=UPI0037C5653D